MLKRISLFGLAVSCVFAGCTLEDPCDDDEYAPFGECIKIPFDKNACGPTGFSCMQTGVADATCEKDGSSGRKSYYCKVISCQEGYHRIDDSEIDPNMKSKCEQDTNQSCGNARYNCNDELSGAASTKCNAGMCEATGCIESYKLDEINHSCVKLDAYACGLDKSDCVNAWRKDIYADEAHQNATVPTCDNGKCALSYCADNFIKISCDEFNQFYVADYGMSIPGCLDGKELSDYICIQDRCPDVTNKTGDDDYDGVINCFDPCPHNPTKSDKDKWWDKENGVGIRCDVKDTDHDGVDDSEDPCPTRANYSDTTDNCGIETKAEDGFNAFHIYNAKDLDRLRNVLLEKNRNMICSESSDECVERRVTENFVSRSRRQCVEGVLYTTYCETCTAEDNNIVCKDKNDNVVKTAPKKTLLRVYLENDINLDDLIEPIFSVNDKDEIVCQGVVGTINTMISVEFYGNNHTIFYRHMDGTDDGIRCSLMNPLFGEIKLSKVTGLKLDYDLKGYGHGLLANKIYSSSISDVEIVNGSVESYVTDMAGVGGLIGSLGHIFSEPTVLSNIKVHLSELNAPTAINVGGIVGKASSPVTLSGNLSVDINLVSGDEYVGGVLGNAVVDIDKTGIDVVNKVNKVIGNNYIGGAFGYINIKNMNPMQFKNEVDLIEGKEYTGGFSGSFVSDTFEKNNNVFVVNRIKKINGDKNTGGFVGYSKASLCPNSDLSNYWLYNHVDSIESESGCVGGIVGGFSVMDESCDICNIYNSIDLINGNNSIGGIVGDVNNAILYLNDSRVYWFKILNVYNKIGTLSGTFAHDGDIVETDWNYTFSGGMIGMSFLNYFNFVELNNVYNYVKNINTSYIWYVGGSVGASVSGALRMTKIYNHIDLLSSDYVGSIAGFVGDLEIVGGVPGSSVPESFMSQIHSDVINMNLKQSHITGGVIGEHDIAKDLSLTISDASSYMNLNIDAIDNESHAFGGVLGKDYSNSNDGYKFVSLFSGNSIKLKGTSYCREMITNVCSDFEYKNVSLYSSCSKPALFNTDGCVTDENVQVINYESAASDFINKAKNLNAKSNWALGKVTLDGKSLNLPVAVTEESVLKSLPAPDPKILKEIGVTD